MSRLTGLASLTLAALVAPSVAAMDEFGGFVDLRLGYQTLGTSYSIERDGIEKTSHDWDITHRLNVDWVGSLGLRSSGGVLWGLGGTWCYNKGDDFYQLETGSFQYWLVRGQIGYGLPLFSERFQLEALPYVGFGKSYIRIHSGGAVQTGDDALWELGGNVNLVYTFDNGFQMGATFNQSYWETSIRDNTDARYRMSAFNPIVGIFIGARL